MQAVSSPLGGEVGGAVAAGPGSFAMGQAGSQRLRQDLASGSTRALAGRAKGSSASKSPIGGRSSQPSRLVSRQAPRGSDVKYAEASSSSASHGSVGSSSNLRKRIQKVPSDREAKGTDQSAHASRSRQLTPEPAARRNQATADSGAGPSAAPRRSQQGDGREALGAPRRDRSEDRRIDRRGAGSIAGKTTPARKGSIKATNGASRLRTDSSPNLRPRDQHIVPSLPGRPSPSSTGDQANPAAMISLTTDGQLHSAGAMSSSISGTAASVAAALMAHVGAVDPAGFISQPGQHSSDKGCARKPALQIESAHMAVAASASYPLSSYKDVPLRGAAHHDMHIRGGGVAFAVQPLDMGWDESSPKPQNASGNCCTVTSDLGTVPPAKHHAPHEDAHPREGERIARTEVLDVHPTASKQITSIEQAPFAQCHMQHKEVGRQPAGINSSEDNLAAVKAITRIQAVRRGNVVRGKPTKMHIPVELAASLSAPLGPADTESGLPPSVSSAIAAASAEAVAAGPIILRAARALRREACELGRTIEVWSELNVEDLDGSEAGGTDHERSERAEAVQQLLSETGRLEEELCSYGDLEAATVGVRRMSRPLAVLRTPAATPPQSQSNTPLQVSPQLANRVVHSPPQQSLAHQHPQISCAHGSMPASGCLRGTGRARSPGVASLPRPVPRPVPLSAGSGASSGRGLRPSSDKAEMAVAGANKPHAQVADTKAGAAVAHHQVAGVHVARVSRSQSPMSRVATQRMATPMRSTGHVARPCPAPPLQQAAPCYAGPRSRSPSPLPRGRGFVPLSSDVPLLGPGAWTIASSPLPNGRGLAALRPPGTPEPAQVRSAARGLDPPAGLLNVCGEVDLSMHRALRSVSPMLRVSPLGRPVSPTPPMGLAGFGLQGPCSFAQQHVYPMRTEPSHAPAPLPLSMFSQPTTVGFRQVGCGVLH